MQRLGPFLMAALLSAFGSVASAAGETCASGDKLLGAGLVDQALSVFIARRELDDECPAGQPPQSGIERAERQRAQGQSLLTQARLVAESDPGQAITSGHICSSIPRRHAVTAVRRIAGCVVVLSEAEGR